ncbi:FISUMP domain-containing protein [Flavobacterium sp. JP2137]|uniref:FISUMP domain-containing protein n=1 Tax=Flavobacterium sp. JP2137 TaxID=3414510 RepID=UPI003D2FCD44
MRILRVVLSIALGTSAVSQAQKGKCGAFIAPGVWKEFMCENIGGNQALFTWKEAQTACPSGFRLPTVAEWKGVAQNNKYEWKGGGGSYATAAHFGDKLILYPKGYSSEDGSYSSSENYYGYYWNNEPLEGKRAYNMVFSASGVDAENYGMLGKFCVRCIAN